MCDRSVGVYKLINSSQAISEATSNVITGNGKITMNKWGIQKR